MGWRSCAGVAVGVLAMLCSPGAFADTMGLGSDGSVTVCSDTLGVVFFAANSNCNSPATVQSGNTGTFASPDGNSVITGMPWSFLLPMFAWVPSGGGNFVPKTTPASTSFTWGGGSNALPPNQTVGAITGRVTWTVITDGISTPQVSGVLVIDSNANSGKLLTDYPVGTSVSINYSFHGWLPTIEAVANHANGVSQNAQGLYYSSGTGSSGDIPSVPEASSILLFGTGVLTAGTVVRWRRRRS
jgi:hypothetical protein